jgi:aminocarboxymuconate-semialdehyde decarboxylase
VTVVDVHTHFIPRFVLEEAADGGAFGVREDDGRLVHPQGFRYPVTRDFLEARAILERMDETGVDVSILSSSPTLFFYDERADEAVDFARRSNDALAALVAGEERLRGIATLPLQEPAAAAGELERAVHERGLVGAQIGTNCGPRQLDAPELEPVLEAAERLGVPLVLHPYYVGPKPGLEDFYLTNSLGNPLDTCVAAVRLIHTGALDRFPRLKIVLVHGGGFLPYQLGRFDRSFAVRPEPRGRIGRTPSAYLDRFWLDTITHSDPALAFLAGLVGERRLVVGSDLPFDMGDPRPVDRLPRLGIDPHGVGRTALELFGLVDGEDQEAAAPTA